MGNAFCSQAPSFEIRFQFILGTQDCNMAGTLEAESGRSTLQEEKALRKQGW